MSSNPTSAHDSLNVSPPPSLTSTLPYSEAPSSDKLSEFQIPRPPSSYQPSFLRHSDTTEQTLVNDTPTYTITPTPITPIQPNASQNLDTPSTSRHEEENASSVTPFTIALFIILILALGGSSAMVIIPFGCSSIIGRSSMETCTKVGAAGGVFAFIPTLPAIIIACDIYNKTTSFRVSICMALVTFPLIIFVFLLLSAVIGWQIVKSVGDMDFQVDVHIGFSVVAISSAILYLIFLLTYILGASRLSLWRRPR